MQASFFLNRLGLDPAADERAIKRAYARELKQIDQEADAAGFQTLRQAYEMALHWVKHKPAVSFAPPGVVPVTPLVAAAPAVAADAAEPEAVHARPAGAPVRDADSGEDPVQQAHEVFEFFLAVCAEMAGQGKARDAVLWRKKLQQCAGDERLLNLNARAHFEFFVARLLANGWRPGHEGLFVAARQLFGWEKDRRRLMEFGHLGGWLNQAIDEAEVFTQQHSADCSGQADALARVREEHVPGTGELLTHVPHLHTLVARFPAWTGVIASSERIEQWMALERDIPAWRRRLRLPSRHGVPEADTGTGGGGWWMFFMAMIVIRLAIGQFGSTPGATPSSSTSPPRVELPSAPAGTKELEAEAAYRRAAGSLYMEPGTRQLAPTASRDQAAPRMFRRALNEAERDAISHRARFHSPHARPGSYKVEFIIELDEDGAIAALTKRTASELPLFDKKVEEAIRASAPFGPDILRKFGLAYTWTKVAVKTPAVRPEKKPPTAE